MRDSAPPLAVIGAGYVGLATAAMLVDLGFGVVLVDIDQEKIDSLEAGVMPILEPGLEEIIVPGTEHGSISFAAEARGAIAGVDLVFVCVGTPMWHTGDADLSQMRTAVAAIDEGTPGATVVIKSTVPPGTNRILCDAFPSLNFVSNPEFLRQGSAVADTLNPDRIVIGARDGEGEPLVALYQPLATQGVPIIETSPESAELIKYSANSLLGIKVAFINEIADLCEATGANIDDVALAIGLDPRIGPHFLKAGPGFGGSCFPKDTMALIESSKRLGAPATIVDAAVRANTRRRGSLARRVVEASGRSPRDLRVGVLGLAFKAGTDDARESPAVDLVTELIEHGAKVRVYDPVASGHADRLIPDAEVTASPLGAATGADVIVVSTEWEEFAALDFQSIADAMRGTTVVDLRNHLDQESVTAAGLTLHGIGRPTALP